MPKRFAPWVILLLGLLAYCQTLNYPFVWDDFTFIVENPAVQQLSAPGRYFSDPTTLSSIDGYHDKIYRPLRTWSFALLYRLGGGQPQLFHLTNVLLHALCGLLVLLLTRRLLGDEMSAQIAAALFAAHPLHSEAVSWISSLGDIQSTLFYLCALYCAVHHQRRIRWLGMLAALPLALLSKEMAITLPAALLLLAFWRGPQPLPERRELMRLAAVAALICLAYLWWRTEVLQRLTQETWSSELFMAGLLKPPLLVWHYSRLLLLPLPLLAFRPPLELHVLISIMAWLLLLGTLFLAWKSWRAKGLLGITWLWFFTALLPVLNFVPLWVDVAERFAYLPSVPLLIAAGWGLTRLPSRRVAVICVAGCLLLTWLRNPVWSDDLRLARANHEAAPAHLAAIWNLGTTNMRYGEWQAAEQAYEDYLRRAPQHVDVLVNLAAAQLQQKKWDAAEAAARQALQMVPNHPLAKYNLDRALNGRRTAQ